MKREEALKAAKPILFNTEMVKAILGNRKTVTRRIIKSNEADLDKCRFVEMSMNPSELRVDKDGMEYPHDLKGLYATFEQTYWEYFPLVKAPYQVEDILYVRETWCESEDWEDDALPSEYLEDLLPIYYRADYEEGKRVLARWHPSVHMPKEAARIFLRVTDVRVECLQDITPEQIEREGIYQNLAFDDFYTSGNGIHNSSQKLCYRRLWDSTVKKSDIAKYGWAANPWVWVIEFEMLEVEA